MKAKAAAAVVIAILVVGVAAYATFVLVGHTPGVESSQSSSKVPSASCSITGAPVGGELQVLSDSGTPIAGAQVKGSSTAYCDGQAQVIRLPVVTTNSSGWVDLEPVYAAYDLTVTYSGHTYSVSLPNQPMFATYAVLRLPSGAYATSYCFGGSHCGLHPSAAAAYTVNATLVSRFCSNSSAIAKTGGQAAELQPTGSMGPVGFSIVNAGWKNAGSTPLSVEAVCIDAVGVVPAGVANVGPTATTLRLSVSPSGPIEPGQQANITASFEEGSGFYYMPQGGLGITVIASDGSSVSVTGPEGVGYLVTTKSPVPVVSIENASISGGGTPKLSAQLSFDSSDPITEVDVYVDGTYIGTVGVGHDTAAQGAPTQYSVSYDLRIVEPGRVQIVTGGQYSISFVAATRAFTETSVSISVAAG
jgi:hypothetical protein